jgi:WD40 repeat protein
MPITVACTCGKSYPVKDEFAGLKVQCPDCGAVLTIPVPRGYVPPRPTKPPPPPERFTPPPPTRSAPPRRHRRRSLLAPILIVAAMLLVLAGLGGALIIFIPQLLREIDDDPQKPDRPAINSSSGKPTPSSGPWKGHAAPIRALGFSVDGRFVLSAAGGYEERNGTKTSLADNSIRFWEADTGKEHRLIGGFHDAITAAAFSPDAHFAVLGCAGQSFEVCLYDLQNEKEIRRFAGHTAKILSVAISADGRRIVSGGADNSVRVWDAETGKQLFGLLGHEKPIYSLSLSASGSLALSGSGDGTLRLWDLGEGLEVQKYTGHADIVWAAALSPDGKRAASAGGKQYADGGGFGPGAMDYSVRIWDAISGEKLAELRGHTDWVGALAFSSDGKRLLSGGSSGVRLWQVEGGRELAHFSSSSSFIRAAAISPDARRAVWGSEDGTVTIHDLPAGITELAHDLGGHDLGRRLAAARALGKLGPEARSAVPDLLRALTDDNADVRTEALTSLQLIGSPEAKDVPLLVPLLRNVRFPDGQRYALEMLGKLGPAAEPAVSALVEGLSDANDRIRFKSAELLGAIGPAARARAWSPLVDLLLDDDPAARAVASAALVKLGPPNRSNLDKLRTLLDDRREDARRYALTALAAMGDEASDAAPVLRKTAANDAIADLRALALAALQRIQPTNKETVETFGRCLADSNDAVCEQAARGLAAAGPKHGALPSLLQAMEHRNANVVRIAGEALARGPLDKSQVPMLTAALQSKNVNVRLRTVEALGRLGDPASTAINTLCDLLKSKQVEERRAVVVALGRIGKSARAAGPRLVESLKDNDVVVMRETAMTLAQIGADEVEQAIPQLVKILRITQAGDASQIADRDRARKLLVSLGQPAARGLAQALRSEFATGKLTSVVGKANAEARATALLTLEEMGAKANVPEVFTALAQIQRSDPVPVLRAAAKKLRAELLKAK